MSLLHCNCQLTAATLCPKFEKMMAVSKAVTVASKPCPGQPAWAIAMLSMLLQDYQERAQHFQPDFARAFLQERVENVRECTRNLMAFLGARLESMPILWSVCSAFRVFNLSMPPWTWNPSLRIWSCFTKMSRTT